MPRRPASKPGVHGLGEGDHIDFGVSVGFKTGGTEWWVKAGGSTTIRPGETSSTARNRLSTEVMDYLDTQVAEVQEAQK